MDTFVIGRGEGRTSWEEEEPRGVPCVILLKWISGKRKRAASTNRTQVCQQAFIQSLFVSQSRIPSPTIVRLLSPSFNRHPQYFYTVHFILEGYLLLEFSPYLTSFQIFINQSESCAKSYRCSTVTPRPAHPLQLLGSPYHACVT